MDRNIGINVEIWLSNKLDNYKLHCSITLSDFLGITVLGHRTLSCSSSSIALFTNHLFPSSRVLCCRKCSRIHLSTMVKSTFLISNLFFQVFWTALFLCDLANVMPRAVLASQCCHIFSQRVSKPRNSHAILLRCSSTASVTAKWTRNRFLT